MSDVFFNILIRHKEGRPTLERCLKSLADQSFTNFQPHLYIDKTENPAPYHYNLFCNGLKEKVVKGYFFYLDDDDALADRNILSRLSEVINGPAVYICQFLREGRPKPPIDYMKKGIIKLGWIGGGCAVVHYSFKNVANWKAVKAADYYWIKEMEEKGVPFKFIPIVLQKTFNKGNGK